MTIYIENFLIQNIIINFCLLRLVMLTLKPQYTNLRLIISSIVGASFSVLSAVVLTNNTIINILKILCSLSMLKIAFKQTSKETCISLILLFSFTYAFGGAIMSISSSTYTTNFGIITSSNFNLEAICLIIIVLTFILEKITNNLKNRLKTNNYIYQITLQQNNNRLSINAFLDTGNLLNLDGKPVLILDIDSYLKLTKTTLLDFYLKPNKTIQTHTVAGSENMKLFTIDCVKIKTKNKTVTIKNQLIAVNTHANFKTNYKALLSPLML